MFGWQGSIQCLLQWAAVPSQILSARVPITLVYHFDETFFYYQPMAGAMTWEAVGTKTVAVIGAEAKEGGTVVLGGKLDGSLLRFQVRYAAAWCMYTLVR
jgi:hypothetical protein